MDTLLKIQQGKSRHYLFIIVNWWAVNVVDIVIEYAGVDCSFVDIWPSQSFDMTTYCAWGGRDWNVIGKYLWFLCCWSLISLPLGSWNCNCNHKAVAVAASAATMLSEPNKQQYESTSSSARIVMLVMWELYDVLIFCWCCWCCCCCCCSCCYLLLFVAAAWWSFVSESTAISGPFVGFCLFRCFVASLFRVYANA